MENSLDNMANLAHCMNMETLYIFSIVISDTFEYKLTEIKSPCNIKYIEVGLTFFLENFLDNPNNVNFWEYNKNTLYILRDSNYSDVKEVFTKVQNIKTNVVRGANQKGHLVSPVDFRLSCYMLILFNMNYSKFNSKNSFNIISKDRYLPSSK